MVLHQFGVEAGQKIDLAKSSITFNRDTPRHLRRDVKSALGIHNEQGSFLYLGEQIGLSSRRGMVGHLMQSRISRAFNCWRGKPLSIAGRRILLQSVLTAIPQYWMSFHQPPRKQIRAIISRQASFLWHGTTVNRNCIPISWSTVTRSA